MILSPEPVEIGRMDFSAGRRIDPEVWSEYLGLKRGERVRRQAHLRGEAQWRGVGDVLPDPYLPTADADLLARAERATAERRAFRRGPEGRFLAALGEIDTVLVEASSAVCRARSARARAFTAERIRCRDQALALIALSARLRDAARDACAAAEDASEIAGETGSATAHADNRHAWLRPGGDSG